MSKIKHPSNNNTKRDFSMLVHPSRDYVPANESELSDEAVAVRNALLDAGLETPMDTTASLSNEAKVRRIKSLMTEVLNVLGLDLNDDSLQDTPQRIAKMYVQEIFSGLDYKTFPKISAVENKMQVDEMVKVSDISVTSTCEHHFVVIDGVAKVAYIPGDKVLGLSKINRIVNFFAQRPQVQERLTRQILVAMQTLLGTEDVAVTVDARHYCVIASGIKDNGSSTETSAFGGVFKTDAEQRHRFTG